MPAVFTHDDPGVKEIAPVHSSFVDCCIQMLKFQFAVVAFVGAVVTYTLT